MEFPLGFLSKHWGYQQVWVSALRPRLFWEGDTGCLLDMEDSTAATDKPCHNGITNPTVTIANPEPSKGECQILEKSVVHPAEPT